MSEEQSPLTCLRNAVKNCNTIGPTTAALLVKQVDAILEALSAKDAELAALRGELEKAKQNYRHIDDDGGCECYDCTVKLLNRSEAALENALSTSVLIWRDRAEKAESALAVFMNLDNWGYDAGDGSFVWEGPVEALPARAQAWPGELGPRTRALPSAEPAPSAPEPKPCPHPGPYFGPEAECLNCGHKTQPAKGGSNG
jgi:hypothetical protein